MDTNKCKSVTFSTDYNLGPQICHVPETPSTTPSPDPQINQAPSTYNTTQGSDSRVSFVPETPLFGPMSSVDTSSYHWQSQLSGTVHNEPLAASTPAATKGQSPWFPPQVDGLNESYLSEGPLESTYSSLSLEPLRVHTQSPPQDPMQHTNIPMPGQTENGFYSSLLLPGSLSANQSPDSMYYQTSERTPSQNTALLKHSQNTHDSGIQIGTPTEAPYSQASLNLSIAESSQNFQQISNELQQQLQFVHTELQKIANLQQQQQMLTTEQLLILPPIHYGSFTDIRNPDQVIAPASSADNPVMTSMTTDPDQLPPDRLYSPSLQEYASDTKIRQPQIQSPSIQHTAVFSQRQRSENPRWSTNVRNFSTQTQTCMQPCATQTLLPVKQSYGTQTPDHTQQPSADTFLYTDNRKSSAIQAKYNNMDSRRSGLVNVGIQTQRLANPVYVQQGNVPFTPQYWKTPMQTNHFLVPNVPVNATVQPYGQQSEAAVPNIRGNAPLQPSGQPSAALVPNISANATVQPYGPQSAATVPNILANVPIQLSGQQSAAPVPNILANAPGQKSAAPVPSISANASVRPLQASAQQNQTILNKKEVHPDNFDGTGKTEWSDYLVHFEQCAKWNQWSDAQKAQMLSIHLRGEAQRLLSGLTVAQLGNYDAIKQILSDRYEPKQKDVTYRCQFRYRKREKGESASDYGYHLNRLAQKAYPNLTLNQLEVHVIDQFITGLNNYELQKHVQFGHPKSLYEAIGLATEYEALDGSIDRIKKPKVEQENIAPIVPQTETAQPSANLTMEQLDRLIEKKLSSFSFSTKQRSKSPAPDSSIEAASTTKQPNKAKQSSKPEKHCTYCKRNNHTIDECRTRKYHERRRTEQQDNQPRTDAAYIITTEPEPHDIINKVITQAIIDHNQQEESTDSQSSQITNEMSSSVSPQVLPHVLTGQINDEYETNINFNAASCMYLSATVLHAPLKLLMDTGSPYSILSLKYFEKQQSNNDMKLIRDDIKLTAADGSPLEIAGKTKVQFQSENVIFEQEFIVANIKGIIGILGMDFLTANDGTIKIKKHILKTSRGRLKLYKQTSNACARILVEDTISVPANTEQILHCKIDQPLLRKENLCSLEPANHLTSKGCFVARTIVDPDCDDVVMSVVNLSDQAVKINQHSVLGQLEDIEEIYSGDNVMTENSADQSKLPDHLQILLDNASDKLSATEKQQLLEVLAKYEDIFIKPDGVLGQTNLVEHDIETGDSKPIKIPPRRIPIFKRNQVDEELEKMISQGIVEPSDSPWSAPICLVKKKDGTCRFCIDFRRLNSVTVRDAYPLPRIDDTLDALSGSMWFSTLDLASGYWQIKLTERSKKKSAFVTPHRGLFHFKVMPFGLTNSPATFQRLMEKILFGLTPEKCLCYLDDIIILGKTFEEGLRNLELVFQRLREANLKLKPKKCFLFQPKVTYLGHVVSDGGISCDPAKIEAIKNWPTPENKSEVRSILGLMGYYRKFIDNFSERASPMTKLTRKRAKFEWNQDCEAAFQDLKECLVNSPILAFPNSKDMFILDCDASLKGIGGVLSQVQNNEEKVIAYASRTLNKAQQQYCTTKRELLAVVTFMKHFKHFLLGQKFLIRTDHAPLIWLRNFKEPEGLIARWISIIETYDYEIQYRPGRHHQNADSLFRIPKRKCPNTACAECYPSSLKVGLDEDEGADNRQSVTSTDETKDNISYQFPITPSSPAPGPKDRKALAVAIGADCNYQSTIGPILPEIETHDIRDSTPNWLPAWSSDELIQMQKDDASISFIIDSKVEGQKPILNEIQQANSVIRALWYQWDNLELRNDILYRRWKDNKNDTIYQMIVPEDMRLMIFENLHSAKTAGHFGRDRTIERIKQGYYWPGMNADVARWIKECDACARVKPGPGLGKSPLHQFRVNEVMRCVAIDIFGPLPLSENGNEYIIVLGDYYSKWVDAWAVPNHRAQTVADKLVVEFFTKFGCPTQIHTDQGREFQSELFRLVCQKFGIYQTRTVPYRPQSDGLVERFNRTLKQMLRIFVAENPKDWDDHLPFLLMAYRATQHKSTGCTPNLIFLQREVSCPLDLMVGPPPNTIEEVCPVQYIEWIKSAINVTHDFVFKHLGAAATRQKAYYDQNLKPRTYEIGDWVWRYYPPTAGLKIGCGWTGPYLVVGKLSELTYSLQKSPLSPVLNISVDDLKRYEGRNQPQSWLHDLDNTTASEPPNNSFGYQTPDNNLSGHQASGSSSSITNESSIALGDEDPIPQDISAAQEGEINLNNTHEHSNFSPSSTQNAQRRIPGVPIIRSRRARVVKPREVWSPS